MMKILQTGADLPITVYARGTQSRTGRQRQSRTGHDNNGRAGHACSTFTSHFTWEAAWEGPACAAASHGLLSSQILEQ